MELVEETEPLFSINSEPSETRRCRSCCQHSSTARRTGYIGRGILIGFGASAALTCLLELTVGLPLYIKTGSVGAVNTIAASAAVVSMIAASIGAGLGGLYGQYHG